MKTKLDPAQARLTCSTITQLRRVLRRFSRSAALPRYALALGLGLSFGLAAAAAESADTAKTSIPWSQIGAKAGDDYQGDGLAVIPTTEGARLHCIFQRLEGEATREGLWLTSTVTNAVNDRFRVMATAVGRAADFGVRRQSAAATALFDGEQLEEFRFGSESGVALRFPPQSKALPRTGTVQVTDKLVGFLRPGLVEEYTVSMDGVRQDFVVLEKPDGAGELAVRLAVSGAQVELAVGGVRLVLENSGRKIAYSRLRVTDATGKELTARMEVLSVGVEVASLKSNSEIEKQKAEMSQSLLTSSPSSLSDLAQDFSFEI